MVSLWFDQFMIWSVWWYEFYHGQFMLWWLLQYCTGKFEWRKKGRVVCFI